MFIVIFSKDLVLTIENADFSCLALVLTIENADFSCLALVLIVKVADSSIEKVETGFHACKPRLQIRHNNQ